MHVFKRTLGENSIGGQQISECTPQCVSVKNTFIDDWIDADNSPADERIVQSMPHNMFGQCLSAQLSGYSPPQKNGNDLADLTTSNKDAACEVSHLVGGTLEEEELIALGTEVVIDGLVKAPSFNGAYGVVQSWDAETGRYDVLLASPAANGQRWAKVKGENLQQAQRR